VGNNNESICIYDLGANKVTERINAHVVWKLKAWVSHIFYCLESIVWLFLLFCFFGYHFEKVVQLMPIRNTKHHHFFLEHAGELRIFILREKEWSNYKTHTPHLGPEWVMQSSSKKAITENTNTQDQTTKLNEPKLRFLPTWGIG